MMQIYHEYWKWECYKNGMWSKVSQSIEIDLLPIAISFTGDYIEYGKAMVDVVNNWEYSCENFLSNSSINRRAYIGQAACSFAHKLPEYIVRQAWKCLSENQMNLANKEADKAISIWEQNQKLKLISKIGRENAIKMAYQTRLLLN